MIIFFTMLSLFVGVATAMVRRRRLTAAEEIAGSLISILLADALFLCAHFNARLDVISYVEYQGVPNVLLFPLLPVFLMILAYEVSVKMLKK
ncbi:hypothetical protein SAMN04488109_3051 [Chryseolinea serpens]|uniref:Uncharacterized protein n=1 Tax=Chryseolinea serpens TaxID=947013 RepID=A0A1M5QXA0_9BACT|nr:hypothetical protein [Chryseolinea serpens]SHH18380.1 hypothetical protein SAMN04488109_3051 [Chryseolinea serpens]